MKRLYLVLILVAGAFVFFSFLAKTDRRNGEGPNGNKDISVFYDAGLPESAVIVQDVEERLEEAGYEVQSRSFDPVEISRFVMSHPDALFITREPAECNLYEMESYRYLLVKVMVEKKASGTGSVTGDEFDDILLDRGTGSVSRKGHRVISYQDLTLEQRPLPVDGVLPSISNIRNGSYSKAFRAHLQVTEGELFHSGAAQELLYDFGGWLDRSFTIIAGGDIMLARGTGKYMRRHGYSYPFLDIAREIDKHDISVANLESPLSSGGKKFFPFKGIYFRAAPGAIEGLTFSGFDVLTLANNHALDWGVGAISETMDLLQKEGIQYTGVGRSREEALTPAVVYVGGTSVAFLSYNQIYPLSVDEPGACMITLSIDDESIEEEIGKIKRKYDLLIVLVHSGIEYMKHPEEEKIKRMRNLVDLGADVVLGTHPHVIQDIEIYRGGLIVYSLGNLIFDQNWSEDTSLGLLIEISFIEGRPVCYDPKVVHINNAQARIITNDDAESVLLSLYSERRRYAYAKR
jgi:poly-gamma-glutamate capsule biosynthesis protein CapA/YwtB (metallophosphatase superfamily)